MLHLATTDGQSVQLHRTVLTARTGEHSGRAFRIDEILHEGGKHLIRASRRFGRHNGRHVIKVVPEIFGIVITEIEETLRTIKNRVIKTWMKIDDGLYMGTLALIPLAYFEHFEMADKIVEFFGSLH